MKQAALFDLDGVIFDTEPQYTKFWSTEGKRLRLGEDFGLRIKGHTLKDILALHFPDPQDAAAICQRIIDFERQMQIDYIRGAHEFINAIREKGVKTAIVTSSDDSKMSNVHRTHPEIRGMFDIILTANDFTRSKPDPECYLLAAERLGMSREACVVFEDSFSGLESGRRAGMTVVGLATTNSADSIRDKADIVVPDFNVPSLLNLFA